MVDGPCLGAQRTEAEHRPSLSNQLLKTDAAKRAATTARIRLVVADEGVGDVPMRRERLRVTAGNDSKPTTRLLPTQEARAVRFFADQHQRAAPIALAANSLHLQHGKV